MKVLMLACSRRAYQLMQNLEKKWIESEPDVDISCKVKCGSLPKLSMQQSVSECVEEWFDRVDVIVFFAATGIAVRSIAPCLKHKSTDPAVIVTDETGKFCISLLSGHIGGANALAERIADMLGAIPVITTATDREGKFSVDDYARRHDLVVTDWKLAKEISVAVLEGERIGLYVDDQCRNIDISSLPETIPEEVHFYQMQERVEVQEQKGICISYGQSVCPVFSVTLQLVPKLFVVGIGCRRHTAEEKLAQAVRQCLTEENIRTEAVYAVASIDLKKHEPGILQYCEKEKIPFLTYSSEELKSIKGVYSESPFVEQTTGVSNVCERSAVAAAQGELVCRKRVYDGVTVAIAKRKFNWSRKF